MHKSTASIGITLLPSTMRGTAVEGLPSKLCGHAISTSVLCCRSQRSRGLEEREHHAAVQRSAMETSTEKWSGGDSGSGGGGGG